MPANRVSPSSAAARIDNQLCVLQRLGERRRERGSFPRACGSSISLATSPLPRRTSTTSPTSTSTSASTQTSPRFSSPALCPAPRDYEPRPCHVRRTNGTMTQCAEQPLQPLESTLPSSQSWCSLCGPTRRRRAQIPAIAGQQWKLVQVQQRQVVRQHHHHHHPHHPRHQHVLLHRAHSLVPPQRSSRPPAVGRIAARRG